MAKLRVTTEYMAHLLFDQVDPTMRVTIVGGYFDAVNNLIVLELAGSDVPNSEWVQAQITQQRRTFTLIPV